MAQYSRYRAVLPFLILVAACAGTGEKGREDIRRGPERPAADAASPRVTLVREASTLGDTARFIGEHVGGGLVVMNGIHEMAVPALDWRTKPYGEAVRELAAGTKNLVEQRPAYYFIYPPGYEALTRLDLTNQLAAEFRDQRISMNLGSGTALYNAFSLLSYHLNRTLVAANAVAEARCGEIVLTEASPAAAVEAILRSARIPADFIQVDATGGYVFIEAANAPEKGPFLMGAGALTEAQRATLAQPISAVIPLPPSEEEGFIFYPEAIPLADALATLGSQAGVRIEATPDLEKVPVNPCTFRNVSLGTALDLLIRQWPVAGFGYEVLGEGIRIRAK